MRDSNKVKFQKWLIQLLMNETHGLSRTEIMERWSRYPFHGDEGINRNTFIKYKEDLSETFGITIHYKYGKGYYIDKNTHYYEQIKRNVLLGSLHMAEILSQYHELGPAIQPQQIFAGREYAAVVVGAIKERRQLELVYQKFGKEQQPKTYLLDPYILKEADHRLYVVAESVREKKMKSFALDRVCKIDLLSEQYSPNLDYDIEHYFDNCVGIYKEDKEPVELVIRSTPFWAPYLRTLPLHASQREPNEYEFHYLLELNHDITNALMKFGPGIEVLEPQEYRQLFRQEVRKMWEMYEEG